MKILAALIIFLCAQSVFATKAMKRACVNGLEDGAASSSVVQPATVEIASLMLEKSKLTSASDAPLRLIIDRNIKKKLAEFKKTFGFELEPATVKAVIERLEGKNEDRENAKVKNENGVRATEKSSRLQWSFAPTIKKANFLPHDLKIAPADLQLVSDEQGGLKIVYRIREAADPERGHHLFDVENGADLYVGDHLSSLNVFKSAKEEWIITVPSVTNTADASIQLRDAKSGAVVKSILLAKAIPHFTNYRFLSNVKVVPYEKTSGALGIAFTWVTAVNKPYAVFELDPINDTAQDIGTVEYDSQIYTSSDQKRIYAYSLSPLNLVSPTDARKTLVVTDILKKTELYHRELQFPEKVLASMLNIWQVAFFEEAPERPILGLNFYGSEKTVIHNVADNKAETFDRHKDANSGGVFVSGEGVTYFLPHRGDKDQQPVINIRDKTVVQRPLHHFYNNTYAASSNVPGLGPIVMYNANNADGKGQFLNLIGLADVNWGGSTFEVTDLEVKALLDTFVLKDHRMFGLFSNNYGSDLRGRNNLHLIQLFGPPTGAQ